jgi:hypothetical protein
LAKFEKVKGKMKTEAKVRKIKGKKVCGADGTLSDLDKLRVAMDTETPR